MFTLLKKGFESIVYILPCCICIYGMLDGGTVMIHRMVRCRDYDRNYVTYGNRKLVTEHEKVLHVLETTAEETVKHRGSYKRSGFVELFT